MEDKQVWWLYKFGMMDTLDMAGYSKIEAFTIHTRYGLVYSIISVQPMTGPTGQIFTLGMRYGR